MNRNCEWEPRKNDEEEGRAVVAGDVVAVLATHRQLKTGVRKLRNKH